MFHLFSNFLVELKKSSKIYSNDSKAEHSYWQMTKHKKKTGKSEEQYFIHHEMKNNRKRIIVY